MARPRPVRSAMTEPVQMAVWTSLERVPLVRAVAQACGMSISHAGCPDASQTRRVASELGAAPEDDLRRLMVDPPGERGAASLPSVVLIADLAADTEIDARMLTQASTRGVRIATLEPLPASALGLGSGGWSEGVNSAAQTARRFVPALRTSQPMRDAQEMLGQFADAAAASVESICGPAEGTLGGRLFDALDVVQSLIGEAETVTASYTPAPGLPGAPGETLLGLSGTIGVTLRFSGGRTATVFASDRGASWRRSVTVLGPKGRFTASDAGFEWRDATGAVVDTSMKPEAPTWTAAEMIARAVARLADPHAPVEAPGDLVGVLSMCQAALLAARTGQSESPATIRRMAGMV